MSCSHRLLLNPTTFCLYLFTDNVNECTGQLAALGTVVAVQFIIIILLTIYIFWLKRRGRSCFCSVTIMKHYFLSLVIFFFDMGSVHSNLNKFTAFQALVQVIILLRTKAQFNVQLIRIWTLLPAYVFQFNKKTRKTRNHTWTRKSVILCVTSFLIFL